MSVNDALDLIRTAAGHELLGPTSLVDAAATGGTATTLIDTVNLISSANDQTYKNRQVYFWSGPNAGLSRFVTSVAGDTGTLTWTNALGSAVAAGHDYLLFRDFSWSQWLNFLNETARSLFYDKEVYLAAITGNYKYTLPTPISRGEWIQEAYLADNPFRWTDRPDRPIRWYRLHPLNIQQDLYLVLDASLTSTEQLVFRCRIPYQHPHMSTFSMSRSVLTPFGETAATNPPRNLLIMGMVWRALTFKLRNLTGDARQLWEVSRKEAAQRYAELCAANGAVQIGKALKYRDAW